ncbi:unnamed protein product [Mucor hiemalis]
MKIKQEADTFDDLHSSSSNIPKNEQQSRQAALEAIRRRRRREETESSDEVSRRSESPHHIVKLKKSDNSSPHTTDLKKRKSNNARAQHPLSESSGNGSGKHSKGGSVNRATPKEELDFVRVKPKDQVPIATFWTAMEPYFRNLTDEDRAFLLEKYDNAKLYLIPPLGQYYTDVWAEEDQSLGFGSHSRSSSKSSTTDKLKYLQNNELTDENLLQNDIGCGTLTERLLSSLVTEELLDPSELEEDEEMEDPMSSSEELHSSKHHGRTIMELYLEPTDEIVGFEERLRRELRYAGLFGDDDVSNSQRRWKASN